MAVVDTGKTWANGDQLTPANLNLQWSGATFNSGAVDDSSTTLSSGSIIIKDLGVTTAKLAANAVTAAKLATTQDWSGLTITLPDDCVSEASIADGAVTTARLGANAVTYAKVDVATQAEQEGESGAGIVTPDVFKYNPAAAKAYGVVSYDSSTPTVSGGYNVDSSATDVSSDTRGITFTNAMDDANYTVVATAQGASFYVRVLNKSTTGFQVAGNTSEASGRSISFAVFGTLA